ncbi:MAG TPA: M20 family metallopeptidase [Chloroflexota bacterium]|nr:M20 family metallopeptidase [Chloroflexota bacterium]
MSATELLATLVAIDSVNPSMAAGQGEAVLAGWVADFGRRCGAQVTLEEVLPGRPNARLVLPPSDGSQGEPTRRLLFDIHLDTVPLDTMPDALTPRVEGGRLWGRGACDTKASLTAALLAFERLAGSGTRRAGEICLLCTVDEEYQKRGIAHAVQAGLTADAAIVGEPTNLQPVIAHKGALRWRLSTIGRAAHTSRPENGNNAIYQMVEVIDWLRERIEPQLATLSHPRLTPPTLTVGRIEGGVGVNIVPARCTIEIDRRTLPQEDLQQILAELDGLLAELMRRRPEIRVEREAPFLSERGLETPPEAPVVSAVRRACADVLGPGAHTEPVGVPYGTDATHLRGIPTVVLGPGDIAQAHSAEEWVDLTQVEQAVEVYYRVMASFVAGEW